MPLTRTQRLLINFLAFQAGWFACVLGVAHGWTGTGTAVAMALILLHLLLAPRPAVELRLVLLVTLIGAVWDSLLAWRGLLVYAPSDTGLRVAPLWILTMWALFATTLNVSLTWIKGRTLLAALLGGIGGPLAYLSGQRMGAVAIPDVIPAVLAQGIGWAILTPLLTRLAQRYDGIGAAGVDGVTPRV
jgi:hypothetical protein